MKAGKLLTTSALSAFIGLGAHQAQAQDKETVWNQTLRNGTQVTVDCNKLKKTQQGLALTMAFLTQYEPLDEKAVENLTPWQKQWLMASRNNPSTDPQAIKNMMRHITEHHPIGQDEIAQGYKTCAERLQPPAPAQ